MNIKKLRLALVVLGVLGVLGIGTVYVLRAPIKARVNSIRSERLQTRAEEAFRQEKWTDAARMGQAAFYLDRENKAVQLIVARSLLKLRTWSAVAWWNMILDEPDLPVDELRELTAALIEGKQIEEALPLLSRLVQLDGDNPETNRLWLRSLEVQHRYGRALSLAGTLAESGTDDWSIHQAYMAMQRGLSKEEGTDKVIQHLKNLLEEAGPLALNASRQLVFAPAVDSDLRLKAADYLGRNAENAMDRLVAASAKAKESQTGEAELSPLVEAAMTDPQPRQLEELLRWSRWMNRASWFLDTVDWATYRKNEGNPDAYLALLLEEGRTGRILELTESSAAEAEEGTVSLLYYRSLALAQRGDTDRARATLELAVQTVDPDNSAVLERYLVRDGQWALLSRLYDIILENNPGDPLYLMKALSARYYGGNQDALSPLLSQIDFAEFDTQPNLQAFLLYLNLLSDGYSSRVHLKLEELVTRYPELFDFRLILGVSHFLNGQAEMAEQLLEGVPALTTNAPRYMRVGAIICGMSGPELLLPGEMETLLPRERYLISLRLAQSNR